jgi:putative SOS response-associated peptidase YedK
MCGRYTLHTEKELLARRFRIDPAALDGLAPRYNIAPSDTVLTVRVRRGAREARPMRWGLVPSWSRTASGPVPAPINARAETAAERPAFRTAFRRLRCLLLADGFYEWQPPAVGRGPKLPHWIALREGAPFAFAGLYAVARAAEADPAAAPLFSCALLTVPASPDLAGIHPRMPVILSPEREDAWIDPALDDDVPALRALLTPLPSGALVARAVSRLVNSVRHDGPELLEPWDPPQAGFRLEG